MKTRRTLVILSGGLDSTVLAYHIAAMGPNSLVGLVSVDYGQRHNKELDRARKTATALGVPFRRIDLTSYGKTVYGASVLTGPGDVPEGHYAADTMRATVVPNRNMILIALAVGVGVSMKAECVAYGAHSGDHAIYPDCRPEFADKLGEAVDLCDYQPPSLIRPFISLTKADIVTLGRTLKVPFQDTWTCYNGGLLACGKCGTCVERLEAFNIAGIDDPLLYENREFWRSVVEPSAKQQPLI